MTRLGIFFLLIGLCPSLCISETNETRTYSKTLPDSADIIGRWDAQIHCPGGNIAFGLEISESPQNGIVAHLINGPERIRVPKTTYSEGRLTLAIDHYDSRIIAEFNPTNKTFSGDWKKRRGKTEWVVMAFSAQRAAQYLAGVDPAKYFGRWSVKFEKSRDPAVAIFKSYTDSEILGTFLTTTGDYRYLHGRATPTGLQISCFDGAHAFLFKASLDKDGTMSGQFWSSNTWHEKWTATRDDAARLPDSFRQTVVADSKKWAALEFPNIDGKRMRLDDPSFAGKARIIYIFGSWCPNCHDAAAYFAELKTKYGDRGLSILGLAFEVTGDFKRDAEQVRKYLKRHNTDYPVLIAGISDKAAASKEIKFLDRIRSYPTTVFLDSKGTIRAVHTGFSGPATGTAHTDLRSKFEAIIEKILDDSSEDRK